MMVNKEEGGNVSGSRQYEGAKKGEMIESIQLACGSRISATPELN